MTLRNKLVHEIAKWDRRNSNPYAGAIALRALDRAFGEIETGASVARALYDNFNDRLLTHLEKAAGVAVTYGGGGHDKGRPE